MIHPTDGGTTARKIFEFDPEADVVVVSVLDKDELSDMSKMGKTRIRKKTVRYQVIH